jgi:tRNA nucleotidyltransferase (CCA-adding enzyme)
MEKKPSRMFEVLRGCGALARVLPEVDRLFGVPQRADFHPEVDSGVHLMMVLDTAARLDAKLAVRYACLGHDLGKGSTPAEVLPRHARHEERSVQLVRALSERLRVDNECRALAEVVAREHGNVHRSGEFGAAALLRLLERCDALRRPSASPISCSRANATRRPAAKTRLSAARAAGPRSGSRARSTRPRSPPKPRHAGSRPGDR